MHILHICNDFSGSKVHRHLYQALDETGIEQTIFCPVRKAGLIGNNIFESKAASFEYAHIIRPFHRLAYHIKLQHIFRYLTRHIALDKIDICHATTLFSDGGVAYKIYQQYHIPYVVNIRNTDVNLFLKYMPHTWHTAKKILLHASKIIFVSPAMQPLFFRHPLIQQIYPEIADKISIIPNGLNDYWIDHLNKEKPVNNYQILYVGSFIKSKRAPLLAKAVKALRHTYPDIQLRYIGSGGEDESVIRQLANKHPEFIAYPGQINDLDLLKQQYNSHAIFALPSLHETFGLVYMEALSQNIPVVYTAHEGIDVLIDEHCGEKLNKVNQKEIIAALTKILENYSFYSNQNIRFEQYRWTNIARQYMDIYTFHSQQDLTHHA